ncbi:MAG: tocopherol cyclase family protein, partial [Spirochaetota bacterium]
IIVMDAGAEGTVDGSRLEGRFYMEKDYGRSFPNAWIWLQSNSFPGHRVSVTCSIANVPFVGGAFTGFLAGMSVAGDLFKFTTYTGSRIEKIDADEAAVELIIADRHRRLSIRAEREQGAELRAPELGEMRGRVVETIQSRVEVELFVDSRVVFGGTGVCAGLDIVNPDRLLPHRR